MANRREKVERVTDFLFLGSLQNHCGTRSPDPSPSLASTFAFSSASKLISVSFKNSLAAFIATPSASIFIPLYSFVALPVRRISIFLTISPPPKPILALPAVICTSSVLWWAILPSNLAWYSLHKALLTAWAKPSLILSGCPIPLRSTISISCSSIGVWLRVVTPG